MVGVGVYAIRTLSIAILNLHGTWKPNFLSIDECHRVSWSSPVSSPDPRAATCDGHRHLSSRKCHHSYLQYLASFFIYHQKTARHEHPTLMFHLPCNDVRRPRSSPYQSTIRWTGYISSKMPPLLPTKTFLSPHPRMLSSWTMG